MIRTSLVLLLSLAALADSPKGIDACNRAVTLLDKDKPAEALAILEAAAGTMDPEDEWVWWGNKASCHRDLRQDDQALAAYAKAASLKPDCWFRLDEAILLHIYGRWDEARAALERDVEKDEQGLRKRLLGVLDGPYRRRWPRACRKLEYTGKPGHYRVVSDVGVTAEEMDRLEAEAGKLDPKDRLYASKLDKLCAPDPELVSISNMLELTRKEYMKFVGMKENEWPKGKVCKVFFMSNEKDYLDFEKECSGDGDKENTHGFFDPNLNYMQVRNVDDGSGWVCGLSVESLDTFWHEGWHQFFHLMTDETPIWMNEGVAEFLAKGEVEGNGAKITLGLLVKERGRFLTRYERIRETVEKGTHVPFRKFFRMDSTAWNAGDLNVHYAQAWAVAYFAFKGPNEEFRKDWCRLFRELVKGRKADEAVTELFPDAELDALEKQWLAYIRKLE
jgi:tetratricopeptide (TPR) repeat protein